MRKVIGIGETILDIIFRNDLRQPFPEALYSTASFLWDAWESMYASSVKQGMTM